jgi:hypothetical protein
MKKKGKMKTKKRREKVCNIIAIEKCESLLPAFIPKKVLPKTDSFFFQLGWEAKAV